MVISDESLAPQDRVQVSLFVNPRGRKRFHMVSLSESPVGSRGGEGGSWGKGGQGAHLAKSAPIAQVRGCGITCRPLMS